MASLLVTTAIRTDGDDGTIRLQRDGSWRRVNIGLQNNVLTYLSSGPIDDTANLNVTSFCDQISF